MFTLHHVSHVTCQVAGVMCHVSHYIYIYFFYKEVELVGGGSVINEAFPVQLLRYLVIFVFKILSFSMNLWNFTESAPRPIQSISCDVREEMLYHIVYFLYRFITPTYKGPRSNWSQNFPYLLRRGLKLPHRKISFRVFSNHPAVHNRRVSRRRVHGCSCWQSNGNFSISFFQH